MSIAFESTVAAFDEEKSQQFLQRFIRNLNDAAVVVMTSLGHRVGLFEALAAEAPVTSSELAEKSGLAERYVREWLAVMVTGGIVTYDPSSPRYLLPAEHAAWLTPAAAKNLAVSAQFIPVIAGVESQISDRFRSGGGLDYCCYHRFHDVMGETNAQTVRALLDARLIPLVPGLPVRLAAGIRVLDVGCGKGAALQQLASRYPASEFVGFDLSEEVLEAARAEADKRGLANIRFERRDLPGDNLGGTYDLITAFDAVHDQRDPAGLLAAIRAALAPGGAFLMQDIAGSSHLERNLEHPFAPFLYAISTAHCTAISLGQGGPGLGTMWGEEQAQEMLAEAGFDEVDTHHLPEDPISVYFVSR
jgi:SAM-dependent methyltransferase